MTGASIRLNACPNRSSMVADLSQSMMVTWSIALFEHLDAMLNNLFAPESLNSCHDALETYRKMVSGNNPKGVAAAARGMAQRKDYSARLGEIQTPALVIGGKDDVLSTPESLDALAAAMPNAVRATVPGGHLAPLEHPDEYAAAIADFLKKL